MHCEWSSCNQLVFWSIIFSMIVQRNSYEHSQVPSEGSEGSLLSSIVSFLYHKLIKYSSMTSQKPLYEWQRWPYERSHPRSEPSEGSLLGIMCINKLWWGPLSPPCCEKLFKHPWKLSLWMFINSFQAIKQLQIHLLSDHNFVCDR